MQGGRSNAEWLKDLEDAGAAQANALEELRAYLVKALPGALRSHGPLGDAFVEDVVQETLMRALAHRSEFEGRSRFTTWATTIAVRVAMTELRRRRWQDVSLEEVLEGAAPPRSLEPDPAASPEQATEQRAVLRAIEGLVENELSERQRIAILAELAGMPQEEIGRRLGITRNAVYKLGFDARKKLKQGLESAGIDAAAIRSAFA